MKKNCINNDQKLLQIGKINKFTDSGSSVNLKGKKRKESHALQILIKLLKSKDKEKFL